MRMVLYGRFVDFMPPTYDDYFDDGLIGGHIYARNAERASLRTADYEYYIVENGKFITIDDATFPEKVLARFIFLLCPCKKEIVGVRSSKINSVNPYSDPIPQLGIRLDEKGRKVVDTDYYDEAKRRGEETGREELVQDAIIKEEAALR